MFFLFVALLAVVSSQVINMRVEGPCNRDTEIQIAGPGTNSSASSLCSMSTCSYDMTSGRFQCTVSYDFGASGETIKGVHLHWPGAKFVFNATEGTSSGTVSADAIASPEMAAAFAANPTLSGGAFYLNFHSFWTESGAIAGYVTTNEIHMGLTTACNVDTERLITNTTTNTSATAACTMMDCTFDFDSNNFQCTISYDFGATGELVTGVHLHWRAFTFGGVAYKAQKYVFDSTPNTASGIAEVGVPIAPVNMTACIRSDPSLLSKRFYVNIHSNWAPSGAIAGEVGNVAPPPPAPTTTPPPTTSGGMQSTTTSGSTIVTTTAQVVCPMTCCQLFQLPLPVGWTDFTIRMNYDFASFDCMQFPQVLADQLDIPSSELRFISCIEGSVILRAGAPTAAADILRQQVEEGSSQIPILSYQSGTVLVNAPEPIPYWIFGVIGGAVLLAIIVIIVVACVKRRKKSTYTNASATLAFTRSDPTPLAADRYEPLSDLSKSVAAKERDANSGYVSPRPTPKVKENYVTLQLLTDVVDTGESILQAKRGDIAFVAPMDWADDGEWVFGKVGVREGYLPRSYLVEKKG